MGEGRGSGKGRGHSGVDFSAVGHDKGRFCVSWPRGVPSRGRGPWRWSAQSAGSRLLHAAPSAGDGRGSRAASFRIFKALCLHVIDSVVPTYGRKSRVDL